MSNHKIVFQSLPKNTIFPRASFNFIKLISMSANLLCAKSLLRSQLSGEACRYNLTHFYFVFIFFTNEMAENSLTHGESEKHEMFLMSFFLLVDTVNV